MLGLDDLFSPWLISFVAILRILAPWPPCSACWAGVFVSIHTTDLFIRVTTKLSVLTSTAITGLFLLSLHAYIERVSARPAPYNDLTKLL
ncbi:hypothetical protein F5X98DRAFT_120733 [Xylaria grammica]|nr:hypothetical protein F5X98DRAFT_120733 [Xylaria grammica]